MRTCEHRLRVFLAGSAGGHPPLCRTCVASVIALALGVAVCRVSFLSPERYLCRARVLLLRRHHQLHRLCMIQAAFLCRLIGLCRRKLLCRAIPAVVASVCRCAEGRGVAQLNLKRQHSRGWLLLARGARMHACKRGDLLCDSG